VRRNVRDELFILKRFRFVVNNFYVSLSAVMLLTSGLRGGKSNLFSLSCQQECFALPLCFLRWLQRPAIIKCLMIFVNHFVLLCVIGSNGETAAWL